MKHLELRRTVSSGWGPTCVQDDTRPAGSGACISLRSIPARKRSTRFEILRRVGLATDFIHAHYARPLGNENLARVAAISPFHFIRVFRSVHGATPYQFVQRKRATVAARLLSETDLPVPEVADRVGFDDRASLFRCMQRAYGASPREIRRRVRQAPGCT